MTNNNNIEDIVASQQEMSFKIRESFARKQLGVFHVRAADNSAAEEYAKAFVLDMIDCDLLNDEWDAEPIFAYKTHSPKNDAGLYEYTVTFNRKYDLFGFGI